ncbi:MAG TPA: dihydrolipoyl dehydrogenase [Candidatus Nanopelagicaceae bacterium]|nr:dihydrolipoyl dehydrogenase [Candidatus Nanopelagicaceae bacterium]
MNYDLIIIGAGPGGYHAAVRAAQYDAKVALIEKGNVGGTCLNIGCIPTKALFSSAKLIEKIEKSAKDFGVDIIGEVRPNFKNAVNRKNLIVTELISGIETLIKQRKIDLYYGAARILEASLDYGITINIEGKNTKQIKGKRLIIATGAKPTLVPSFNIDHKFILTSDDILAKDFNKVPESILIVGGGVIGCEFANIFSRFGSKVKIFDYLPSIIANEEQLVVRELKKKFNIMGIEIYENRNILKIEKVNSKVIATTCDSKVPKDQIDSAEKSFHEADLCLVSIGRKPCIEGLGLENTKIELNEGKIVVNPNTLETNENGIYAVGDVTGGILLAHVASYEGNIAVFNALSSIGGFDTFPVVTDYTVIPASIFTAFEIGSVGYKSKYLEDRGVKIRTGRFGYASLGKAKCMGEEEGFLMIITDEETDDILGASCIGISASELIAEIALAMKNGLSINDITNTVHSHPTLSEMVLEAAEDVYGLSIHRVRRRVKQKIDLKEDMIRQFASSENLKKYGLISLEPLLTTG